MTVAEYVAMPHPIRIFALDDGYYAEIKSLRGCLAWGETMEVALDVLMDIKRMWVEDAIEHGWEIPIP